MTPHRCRVLKAMKGTYVLRWSNSGVSVSTGTGAAARSMQVLLGFAAIILNTLIYAAPLSVIPVAHLTLHDHLSALYTSSARDVALREGAWHDYVALRDRLKREVAPDPFLSEERVRGSDDGCR